MKSRTKTTAACVHCSFPAYAPVHLDEGNRCLCFCCKGCREVYLLMRSLVKEGE